MNGEPAAAWTEDAVLFDCAAETLVGVLARPASGESSELGVVIVVGGPQYRAGSHRQFTLLARALAASGHAALRFDCRGMGDSGGAARDFLSIADDVGAAIDALQRSSPGVRRVALWGLCDAASAALLYLHETRDARVERLVLLNPWVRSEQGLARTQVKHYYRRRMLEPAFWAKLASGRIAWSAFTGLLRSVRTTVSPARFNTTGAAANPPFTARMAAAWNEFDGAILLLLSGNDYVAKEFLEQLRTDPAWRKALGHRRLLRHVLKNADHTFSDAVDTRIVEQYTLEWMTTDARSIIQNRRGDGGLHEPRFGA